ncbi:MAG: universal stress protein [Chloroflexota bacterium]|nr:universal stress protein [Chloroflexota bacterium]
MNMNADSMDIADEEERAGRLPSLAAQTPGLDTDQGARTRRDAEAYYAASDAWGSRHILVPLDGSHLAAAALPYAVALARAADARITLLAILEPVPAHVGLPSAAGQEADERRVTESTAYLEFVAAPLRATGLAVTTVVRHGNPAETILADAEDEDCSLVVMGTHGRTGLERARAGSVARHVLRHAIVPTLVVPPGNDAATEGEVAIAEVTVPLDGSDLAEEALPIAARIAAALSVPLTLLRVMPSLASLTSTGWDAGYSAFYPVSDEMLRDEEGAVEEYLQAIAARLREAGLEVGTRWERSVTNRAEEMIAASLAKRPTGIAVMASHGRGGVLRWALGSTAEGVLDQSPCPILIVRTGATTGAGHEAIPVHVAQDAG